MKQSRGFARLVGGERNIVSTLTQTARPQQQPAGSDSSLLDVAFSKLMRGPLGASPVHIEGFNKDKVELAAQDTEIKAIAKGLTQLMGHAS